ncbi:MAG TPA: hypothetical protein VLH09_06490, partial [Bryobacteraceae bacterium]|nr:hypothetical protein [Bryobacteraceae bacterium]
MPARSLSPAEAGATMAGGQASAEFIQSTVLGEGKPPRKSHRKQTAAGVPAKPFDATEAIPYLPGQQVDMGVRPLGKETAKPFDAFSVIEAPKPKDLGRGITMEDIAAETTRREPAPWPPQPRPPKGERFILPDDPFEAPKVTFEDVVRATEKQEAKAKPEPKPLPLLDAQPVDTPAGGPAPRPAVVAPPRPKPALLPLLDAKPEVSPPTVAPPPRLAAGPAPLPLLDAKPERPAPTPLPIQPEPVRPAAEAPKSEAPKPEVAPPPQINPTQINPEPKGGIVRMRTSDIARDPERFQFKREAIGKGGTTDEFRQTKKWNENLAGIVSVWLDPKDGKTYVVNGHHRLELAERLGVPDLNVRYIE